MAAPAMPALLALLALLVGSAAQDRSYEGVVLHERPDLYKDDGITLKDGVTVKPLRLIANRPESGAVGDAMGRLVPILRQAVGQINNMTDILPDYVIELHLADSLCANHKAAQSSLRMIWNNKNEDGYFKMQFGPLCSGPTGAVNDMIQVFNMFQVATISRGAFLSDGNRYPYICRTSPSLQFVADGITHLVMLFGWKQVGAVQDTRSLSASTVTEFKAKVKAAAESYNYTFDEDFLAANHYTIDGKNFNEEDIAKTFKEKAVKIALIALYEDVGAPFYCQLYKQGYTGRAGMTTILALSWWGDSWIAEQVAEQEANYAKDPANGQPECTSEEIFVAAQYMFSMGQTAFLQSDMKHDITGATLNDIYQTYLQDCIADDAEGCHFDFAAYDYDGLALVAKAFHTWIYDQGHSLSEIDYINTEPQKQLYEIVKNMSFLGVSGNVAFFDQIELDCERKGTFSVRQLSSLAINKGEKGWSDVTSFTTSDGFATIVEWRDITWPDQTVTFFGSNRTGFPQPPNSVGSPTLYFGNTTTEFGGGFGFDNVPVDVISCSPGMYSGPTGCVDCPAGKYGEGNKPCVDCSIGKFSTAGSANCQTCNKGQFQDEYGQPSCKNCTSGTVSSESSPWLCTPCPAGQHQPDDGQAECLRCETGYYQPDEGQADCEHCPASRTTKFISALSIGDCVCGEGTYEPFPLSSGSPYKCEACPEGMVCKEGCRLADWSNGTSQGGSYPRLLEQYYSTVDEPVFVYKCLDERNCPGGDPGTCAERRQGFACGRCETGYYSFGGKCNKCNAIELTTAVFPTIPLVGGPLAVVFIFTRLLEPMRIRFMDGSKNRALALIFFYIVHFQTLGIIRQFNLVLPDVITIPWEGMGMVNSGVQFLRPECAGGGTYSDFSVQFALRSILPLIVGVYFLAAYLLFKYVIVRFTARLGMGPRSIFTVGMERDATINAFGTLMYTFSIAVLAIAFDLFKCYPHPNGLSSLRVSPDVLCSSDEWNQMLAIGILAILIYFVASYSLFSWVCYAAPSRYHDPRFRRRWKFLFIKWLPSRWWFGQIFLMKGVFLNLTLVAFRGGALQVMWTGLTLIMYMVSVLTLQPWRHFGCNMLDSIVSYCLLSISLVSVYFAVDSEDADAALDKIIVVFTFIPVACATAGIAYYVKVWVQTPRWEIVDSIKTALAVDSMLLKLTKQGTMGLMHGLMNTTLSDRQMILNSLFLLLAESSSTQVPGRPRLIQREAHFDLVGRQSSRDSDSERCSKRMSFKNHEEKTADAVAQDHEAFVAWCKTCGSVDEQVSRIFKDKTTLTQDEFIDALDSPMAPYAAELCDSYEDGLVAREVFETFLKYAGKQDDTVDITQLYSRSYALGALEKPGRKMEYV